MLNSEDPPITKYSGLSQYFFRLIHTRIIKYILQINKSKVHAFLSFNFNAHNTTITTYDEQVEVISKELKIIKASNIFFMTDVFVCKFR